MMNMSSLSRSRLPAHQQDIGKTRTAATWGHRQGRFRRLPPCIPAVRLPGLGRHARGLVAYLILVSSALAQSAAYAAAYDWSKASSLGSYAGIKWGNVVVSSPRNMNINCLQIDTATPGLRFYTTAQSGTLETMTQTTRQFITQSRTTDKPLALAINASPWSPFVPAEWNTSKAANLQGLAVSEGSLVSPGDSSPSFLVSTTGIASMAATSGTAISGIQMAASGFAFVLSNGIPTTGDTSLHPRTGVGLSEDSRYVYFMTIDGRQPASGGATTDEVGSYLKWFGSWTGINMDGGGSTTMAWWDSASSSSELLNHPRGQGSYSSSDSERHNGNNIGIYYIPEPSTFLLVALFFALFIPVSLAKGLRRRLP